MFKKVKNIRMPSDASNAEMKQIHCSVCKIEVQPKDRSKLYAYDSGLSICKSCNHNDVVRKGSNESGDCEPERDFDLVTDVPPLQLRNCKKVTTDLACGDRDNKLKVQEINVDGKKCCKEEDALHKELYPKRSNEVVVEYKNPHFQESKTSISTNIVAACSKNSDGKENDEMDNCDKDPRPVVCPVADCSKIVTIDSFMLHFLFDHSKVARTTLDDMVPQEVNLKSTNFSTEIQCVASFIMESRKSPSVTIKKRLESTISSRSSNKDNKLLLLLAVRLPISSIKPIVKCDPSAIFTKSIHTQTDKVIEHCSGINTENFSKTSDKSNATKSLIDENEVIILWLCKLDETERVFSITLLGEAKRRGYCYIGDAVHIRDKQDPSLLYERSECLIIKGSAVNRLFNPKGQITAIVSHIG